MGNLEFRTVYCDEAGFTGTQLLDAQQPYFVYAAIVIDAQEANDIVTQLKEKYRFQGNELKSINLLKHNKGKQAIIELLEHVAAKTKIVAHDKKYALAANIFEYTFELCISENNSIFYRNDFHKFISTLLYIHFQAQDEDAQKIFQNFQLMMKPGNHEQIANLFKSEQNNSPIITFDDNSVIDTISLFLELNKLKINDELSRHSPNSPLHRWILDLSNTSLVALLRTIGEDLTPLKVYCDQSKPLSQNREIFDAMIGRTEQAYLELYGEPIPLIFNLLEPMMTVCSHEYPGIQIADLVSGALLYAFKNPQSDFTEKTLEILKANNSFIDASIFADKEHMDLSTHQCVVNSLVLLELVKRSLLGTSLTEGIDDYYELCHFMISKQQLPKNKCDATSKP